MLGRLAALAVCVSLAACANLEPAGRNSGRDPAPARPPVAAPTPAPRAPAAAPTPAPAVVAPAPVVTAPSPAPSPAPAPAVIRPAPAPVATPAPARSATITDPEDEEEVVVPGQRELQIARPGDPRSTSERMEDIRAWDQCVTRVQAAYERDPMRPQLDSPEEYCGRSLGMADRNAIPISRQERRR